MILNKAHDDLRTTPTPGFGTSPALFTEIWFVNTYLTWARIPRIYEETLLGAFFSPCRSHSTGYCQRSLRTNEYNNCCHETPNGRHIPSLQEPFLSPELRWPRAPARCGVPSGPTHPSGSFTAGTGSLCHKPQSSMGKVNYWC